MNIKLKDIVNSLEAIRRINEQKLPIRLAYRIQRNTSLLEIELQRLEKSRVSIIKSLCGVEDSAIGTFSVPEDKQQEFIKEYLPLLEEEVEIDIKKIALSENIEITPTDFYSLKWMFEEE